jgi:hypothetical protein
VSGLLYQLREDFPEMLRLVRGDSVRNFSTAVNYGVRATPSMLLFTKGKLIHRWAGQVNAQELYDRILDLVDPQ